MLVAGDGDDEAGALFVARAPPQPAAARVRRSGAC
jgi:hypothetical protein